VAEAVQGGLWELDEPHRPLTAAASVPKGDPEAEIELLKQAKPRLDSGSADSGCT